MLGSEFPMQSEKSPTRVRFDRGQDVFNLYFFRRNLKICIVLATLGEAFLSLVWGLYDYQFRNLPLFVPLDMRS
jgi:hypothetical protein